MNFFIKSPLSLVASYSLLQKQAKKDLHEVMILCILISVKEDFKDTKMKPKAAS